MTNIYEITATLYRVTGSKTEVTFRSNDTIQNFENLLGGKVCKTDLFNNFEYLMGRHEDSKDLIMLEDQESPATCFPNRYPNRFSWEALECTQCPICSVRPEPIKGNFIIINGRMPCFHEKGE